MNPTLHLKCFLFLAALGLGEHVILPIAIFLHQTVLFLWVLQETFYFMFPPDESRAEVIVGLWDVPGAPRCRH